MKNLFVIIFHRNQDATIDYNSKKRTIQRLKRGILPRNPTTVDAIQKAFDDAKVMATYGHSLHVDKPFRFFDGTVETKDYSFCVFSSKATVQLIEKKIEISKREILMDATFRIVPVGPFKQLLILYIRKQKKVMILCT